MVAQLRIWGFAFPQDQVTLSRPLDPGDIALRDELLTYADLRLIGVVLKGRIFDMHRGGYYLGGGLFQPDRSSPK